MNKTLLINAHSAVTAGSTTYKIWNSVFHVNMQDGVKPNMHYTVNITINGGATPGTAQGDCGAVITYEACSSDGFKPAFPEISFNLITGAAPHKWHAY